MATAIEYPAPTVFAERKGIGHTHVVLYEILLNNLGRHLPIGEIETLLTGPHQSNLSRRLREIRTYLDVEYTPAGYRLIGLKDGLVRQIDRKTRFLVLAHGKCLLCGRKPATHDIVLVVDHIIPISKGGTNDISNLQPLCEDCNSGKKDLLV